MMGKKYAEPGGSRNSSHGTQRVLQQPLSQASSNQNQGRLIEIDQGPIPAGVPSCGEVRGRAHSPNLTSGSVSMASEPQTMLGDNPNSCSKPNHISASRPPTIAFDLNAVPELEEGEVQQEETSLCDLSLSLALGQKVASGPCPLIVSPRAGKEADMGGKTRTLIEGEDGDQIRSDK